MKRHHVILGMVVIAALVFIYARPQKPPPPVRTAPETQVGKEQPTPPAESKGRDAQNKNTGGPPSSSGNVPKQSSTNSIQQGKSIKSPANDAEKTLAVRRLQTESDEETRLDLAGSLYLWIKSKDDVDREAIEALKSAACTDPSDRVREHIIERLLYLKSMDDFRAALSYVATDRSPKVRKQLLEFIGDLGSYEYYKMLRFTFWNDDEQATQSMKERLQTAIAVVKQLEVSDPDEEVRDAASAARGSLSKALKKD